MVESRVLDQGGLGPQIQDVLGRINWVAFDVTLETGIKVFVQGALDIEYQSGELCE